MPAAPILTVAEMAACDASAIAAGVPGIALMRRAGEAVAQAIRARFTPRPIVVLCGPGKNGGDGYVAASALQAAGWPVRVGAARSEPSGDAAEARAGWSGPVAALTSEGLEGAGVVVDALFGAGLARPLDSGLQHLLRCAEASPAALVAVDLPSGLSGDTGRPLGWAPRAELTVTFHAKKLAHVLEPGRSLCGEVVVADIGLAGPAVCTLFENTPELWASSFPWPGVEAHKAERGRLLVVSGGPWSTGAARLAARAGLRVGAGLVTLASPLDALASNAAHLEAVMLKPFDTDLDLADLAETADAAVIGPAAGVQDTTAHNVFALAESGAALVVDADALTVFRDDPAELFRILDRDDVLTPHPGEFDRIFPGLLAREAERVTAARSASRKAGAVVILKGSDTVIAAPDGRAAVNGNGAPWLATAGSGDVLAGLVGGLLAQGMDSFQAACAAVFIHGEAGRRFGPGLIAEDLPGLVPGVLARLRAGAVPSR